MDHASHREAGTGDEPCFEFISFLFASRRANAVFIAGTFNSWQAHANPMHRLEDGFHWRQEMALPSGTYEYCMVVDGEWMSDPRSPKIVANPFGGWNSLLKVSNSRHSESMWSMAGYPVALHSAVGS